MSDHIEVNLNRDRNVVALECGADAFARIARLISVEAQFPDDIEIEKLTLIQTYKAVEVNRPQRRWRDRVALLGCGLIGFVLLFVFIAGIGAIIQWFRA